MTDWRDDPEIVALRDAVVRAICPGGRLNIDWDGLLRVHGADNIRRILS